MKIVSRIDIAAPTDVVFRWMTDRDKLMQWQPVLDSSVTHATGDRVGTTHRQVYDVRGKRVQIPVEVIAYEKNCRLAVRTRTSKQDTTVDYRLEELVGGTRITTVTNIRFRGFTKIVTLFTGESLRDRIVRGFEEDFARLKQLCERDATT